MTAPLIELKRVFPQAELHVAVTAEWAPLLMHIPEIDRIWPCERHREKTARARALARLALQLRRERFDVAVNFHASPSSAGLCFATGAKTRSIHFHGHRARNRFSTVEVPDRGILKPGIERDMDAIRALGVPVTSGHMPRLSLTPEELHGAKQRVEARGLSGPLLAIGLGASRPTKSWPLERFAQIANQWVETLQGSVIALLGDGEAEVAQKFSQLIMGMPFRDQIQIIQGPPVRETLGWLSNATVFLGNDSGPKHMAVALGVPTITLFGPEDPFEWHPYPRELHPYFFIENLACRRDADPGMPPWCGLTRCTVEKHRCMTDIEVTPVFDQVLRMARNSKQETT